MSLRKHGLCEHFELSEGFDHSNDVKLIHEFFLSFFEKEVLFVTLVSSLVPDTTNTQAPD
jgi:hypothetical protein